MLFRSRTGEKIVVSESKPKNITLKTRTTTPLNNETDVNDYLAQLKKQLIDLIDQGYSVTVVK